MHRVHPFYTLLLARDTVESMATEIDLVARKDKQIQKIGK